MKEVAGALRHLPKLQRIKQVGLPQLANHNRKITYIGWRQIPMFYPELANHNRKITYIGWRQIPYVLLASNSKHRIVGRSFLFFPVFISQWLRRK
jgi:hypothetical protein